MKIFTAATIGDMLDFFDFLFTFEPRGRTIDEIERALIDPLPRPQPPGRAA